MSFTTFVDDLALVQVLLALVASVLAYAGVRVWWAIRTNDPQGLRSVLRGTAVPMAGLGLVALVLALWGEMTWPFLASDGLGGYNIFFFDPIVLLGIVLLSYAATVVLSAKLQYVGLVAFVAGAVTMFYGYTGYTASPAFTKDPLDTLLLYLAFGAAGVFALPASIVVDYFLGTSDAGRVPFAFAIGRPQRRSTGLGTRAAQPIVPPVAGVPHSSEEEASSATFRFPAWAQVLVLLFPVFVALAGIAAFWYFGVTLPGHLGSGPAGAP